MACSIAITPASGSITSTKTVCRVNVTGGTLNDTSNYSTAIYPTEPEIRYYLKASKSGVDSLISPDFAVSTDGKHEWNSLIFPAAGTWKVATHLVSDDSEDASINVVVA